MSQTVKKRLKFRDDAALAPTTAGKSTEDVQRELQQLMVRASQLFSQFSSELGQVAERIGSLASANSPTASHESTAANVHTAVNTLSKSELKPEEVIKLLGSQLSLATLYRAVDDGRFYCITKVGKTNGRLFPEWQFHQNVHGIVSEITRSLAPRSNQAIHSFWISEAPSLNELSPAEVLAGLPFITRLSRTKGLHKSQQRLLQLPLSKRQKLVENQASEEINRLREQG